MQAGVDDRAVLVVERVGDREQEVLLAGVVLVRRTGMTLAGATATNALTAPATAATRSSMSRRSDASPCTDRPDADPLPAAAEKPWAGS